MDTSSPLSHSPNAETYSNEQALDHFLDFVKAKNIELYPAQEEAILELFNGNNVLLNTPTGSGKSLVAIALHYQALAQKRRSIYTSPVKALVNEKFFSLCKDFGPRNVGIMTGDAAVNREAPILCCTAEILANMALRKGGQLPYQDIVVDEFHYYSDRDRGTAWQIPLLCLEKSRFLLMTATFGDTRFFEKALSTLNSLPTKHIYSSERPVPLKYDYSEESLEQTVQDLLEASKAPLYIVNFSQREASQVAQSLTSIDICSKERKREISSALAKYQFRSPYGKELLKLLKVGIGVHHAGILPKYRILVEKLAQNGLLQVISGTDTLGVGVNIPIRTVILTKLCKFDGRKTALLTARDFHQICGRAGRKGFDDIGFVVSQAPAHVIENKKLARKALANPKKKYVKAKPPEKGYIPWNEETFAGLQVAPPEHLRSVFRIDHGVLLNVLSRQVDGCEAMKMLIRNCHESDAAKDHLRKRAFQLFRAVVKKKIVEIIPPIERLDSRKVQVNVELQDDFSLNQALSLFLIDTLARLDPFAESFALDLLSLVESILESPQIILRRQLDKIKGAKIAELKLEGVDYFDRMTQIEDLEHPKPLADFIYNNFNSYLESHPWVGQESIRPKSIAREIYENYYSFSEYIREYNLARSEGILLRYISDIYRLLTQTVPEILRNDTIDEMILYFRNMLKETDSSLLNEWKRLQNMDVDDSLQEEKGEPVAEAFTPRTLTVLVRNSVFSFLRELGRKNLAEASALLENADEWDEKTLASKIDLYYRDHERINLGPDARSPKYTIIQSLANPHAVPVELIITDPQGFNDWSAKMQLSISGTTDDPIIVMALLSLGPLG